jgi:hypothetical protein
VKGFPSVSSAGDSKRAAEKASAAALLEQLRQDQPRK